MSFNQFMHPRNIYRNRPNYKELAEKYPEFGDIVLYDDHGNVHVNYDDLKSLRILTKTLFKNDFELDVDIPEGRLVPTLPMRLNYLLWIEDLLAEFGVVSEGSHENIVGFDIGTGCCAVFPLLGIRLNPNWRFIASEIDQINYEYSVKNVQRNSLQGKIEVLKNNTEKMFFDDILRAIESGQKINFTMTNPPFFQDQQESDQILPKSNKFHSKKIQETSTYESNFKGGEVEFVKQIINESIPIGNRIQLYTVLLGKKKSFNELRTYLSTQKEQNILSSFTFTELCQGNTKRWALAWTFSEEILLSKISPKKCKASKQLSWIVPRTERLKPYKMENIVEIIRDILTELRIEFDLIVMKRWFEFEIRSDINTWSNQRRKRRQQAFQSDLTNNNTNVPLTPKRQLDDDDDDFNSIEAPMEVDHNDKKLCPENRPISGICKTDLTLLLHCLLTVKRYQSEIEIKIVQKERCRDNDTPHQLFQLIKNRLSE